MATSIRCMSHGTSATLPRANFDTRIVDSVAHVKIANGMRMERTRAGDTMRVHRGFNPVSLVDEWAVLADGSVALVRGHDCHFDWIRPDGTKTSSPKLPFDWKKLSDADKQVLMNSVHTAFEASVAATAAKRPTLGENGRPRPTEINTLEFVPLSQIGDDQPPIRSGAVRPDLDNNLWILPATSAQSRNGELVYDIVNREGQLTHRVRIPLGHSIAGFGHNGIVFLMAKEADKWVLKRTKVLGATRGRALPRGITITPAGTVTKRDDGGDGTRRPQAERYALLHPLKRRRILRRNIPVEHRLIQQVAMFVQRPA